MKIALISRDLEVPSSARLAAACAAAGHSLHLLPTLRALLELGPRARLICDGDEFPTVDVVIARIGTFLPDYALTLLRALEERGTPALNGSAALACSRDKAWTQQRLSAAQLPQPRTVLLKDLDGIDAALDSFGAGPWVVKPTRGAMGRGVQLFADRDLARRWLRGALLRNADLMVQEFVGSGAPASDLRLLVVAGEVVAAMRRTAPAGGFVTNLHSGGCGSAVEASAEECQLAVAASAALQLGYAGVDLMQAPGGVQIIEVNGSPGLEGIESVSGVDVASRIVAAAAAAAGHVDDEPADRERS